MTDAGAANQPKSSGSRRRVYVATWLIVLIIVALGAYVAITETLPYRCHGPGTPLATTYVREPVTFARPLGNRSLILGHAEQEVIKLGGAYYMYYRNDTSNGKGLNSSIWVATSSDGLTWHDIGPVVLPATFGWDSAEVIAPSILLDGGKVYIYYEATDRLRNSTRAIGVALSENPTGPFARYSQNPVLEATDSWETTMVGTPVVTQVNTCYYMFYHGFDGRNDRVGVAYSESPLGPWTRDARNPILDVGSRGSWDHAKVAPSSAIPNGDAIWVFYDGFDGKNESTQTSWRIGLFKAQLDRAGRIVCIARNEDPVLDLSPPTFFDDNTVQTASVIVEGSQALMYYSGNDGFAFRLGRAVGPLPWTRQFLCQRLDG